jgi:hypothetical protein
MSQAAVLPNYLLVKCVVNFAFFLSETLQNFIATLIFQLPQFLLSIIGTCRLTASIIKVNGYLLLLR